MSGNLTYADAPFPSEFLCNMFFEKFLEVFACDAGMNVIIHLYGYADTVAFSDAEAAGKHDLILNMMFLYGFFKKLYNIGRALEVAGRANTNLNEQHMLIPLRELL